MASFSAQLKVAQDRNLKRISDFNRKIMLDLDERVVAKTPVDTGRARANWQPSILAPVTSETETTDKSGQATISTSQALHASSSGFDVMYLTNNLIYIEPLENGSSQQAPLGMAKLSIQEVARQFK